jgi:hypothetical protein
MEVIRDIGIIDDSIRINQVLLSGDCRNVDVLKVREKIDSLLEERFKAQSIVKKDEN